MMYQSVGIAIEALICYAWSMQEDSRLIWVRETKCIAFETKGGEDTNVCAIYNVDTSGNPVSGRERGARDGVGLCYARPRPPAGPGPRVARRRCILL